tara:strand:+ start:34 stop:1782 length:1749 start_codon:yes stop_codon:yes gene_type:complete
MGTIYEPNLDNLSGAEKVFFRKVREEHDKFLSDWDIIFDLNIDMHNSKRDGQCDCLFIGPLGLFVVEIKGGDYVDYSYGIFRWGWKDGIGNLNESHETPIAQAKGNYYSIMNFLKEKISIKQIDFNKINSGFGVAFPQADLGLEKFTDSIDIEQSPDEYFDINSISVLDFIKKLANHCKKKLGKKDLNNLNLAQIKHISRRLKAGIRSISRNTDDLSTSELLKLSKDQYEMIETIDFDKKFGTRLLIEGGAGTGKTVVAKFLAEQLSLSDKNILWLSFNKPFTDDVKKHFEDNDRVSVYSYESYRLNILKDNGYKNIKLDEIGENFIELINNQKNPKIDRIGSRENNKYQILIIDEAQDVLDTSFLFFLDHLLESGYQHGDWAIFMDKERQSGLFNKMQPEVYEDILKYSNQHHKFTKNLRNAYRILEHLKIEEKFDLIDGKREIRGDVVIKDFRNDLETNITQVIFEIVSKEKFVTILSPYSQQKFFSDALNASEFKQLNKRASNEIFYLTDEISKRKQSVKGVDYYPVYVDGIKRFKGLETPTLILYWPKYLSDHEDRKKLIYTAMTRALNKVYIIKTPD